VRLREWMDKTNTSILQVAERTGSSVHTVKKWLKCFEKDGRTPRPAMQAKIRDMSGGDVMPNDWVN
jgi:transposase